MASHKWMAPREGGYTGGPDGPLPPPPQGHGGVVTRVTAARPARPVGGSDDR